MEAGSGSTPKSADVAPYTDVLDDIVQNEPNWRNLYDIWLRTENCTQLLWAPEFEFSDSTRRRLATRWLQWQIFDEYGKVSKVAEIQICHYFGSLTSEALKQWHENYWKMGRSQKLRKLRDAGIELPEDTDIRGKLLIQGVPGSILDKFQFKGDGSCNLEQLIAKMSGSRKSDSELLLYETLVRLSLSQQLVAQGFSGWKKILEDIGIKHCRKHGFRTAAIDMEMRTVTVPVNVWNRRVTLRYPRDVDIDLHHIQKLLLGQWSLLRFNWFILNVRDDSSYGIIQETANNHPTRSAIASQDSEGLYRILPQCGSLGALLLDRMERLEMSRLMKKCNPQQKQIVEAMPQNVVRESLVLGPGSKTCMLFLAKHFKHDHPHHKILRG